MMKWTQKLTEKIPLWVYNAIAFISAILGILSFVADCVIFAVGRGTAAQQKPTWSRVIIYVTIFITIALLIWRLLKFRTLANNRIKTFSIHMHNLTHTSRDTFFDIQHRYKLKQLNNDYLREKTQSCLMNGLDSLCAVLKDVTGYEVSACIKLLEPGEEGGTIVLDTAKVTVFCRSRNSHTDRRNYDRRREEKGMLLRNDTALMLVVDTERKMDHFYCRDLDKYIEEYNKVNPAYQCPTENRSRYYNGVMIFPIRIAAELLHFRRGYRVNAQDMIGFLCIDSLSKDAFREDQEDYNCHASNAFADQFYIILNEFSFYLSELNGEPTEPKEMAATHSVQENVSG